MIADLHIHSKYSYDSLLSPRRILKQARRRRLDIIAVTDHGTIRGGQETLKLNRERNPIVIQGCEVHSELGDIIGLYLNEELKSRVFIEIIEEIKEQGGLAILPHPFRGHRSLESIVPHVDAIEIFNSRSTAEQNANALMLAKQFSKPFIAGSDAHFSSEIGLGRMIVPDAAQHSVLSLSSEDLIFGERSPWYMVNLSRAIKYGRRRHLFKLTGEFGNIFLQMFKNH